MSGGALRVRSAVAERRRLSAAHAARAEGPAIPHAAGQSPLPLCPTPERTTARRSGRWRNAWNWKASSPRMGARSITPAARDTGERSRRTLARRGTRAARRVAADCDGQARQAAEAKADHFRVSPYVLTISTEGIKLVPRGKRKGYELDWESFVSGDAALAVALNATLAKAAALPAAAPATPARKARSGHGGHDENRSQ